MTDREKARQAAIEDWPIKGAPITDAMSAAFDAGWDARGEDTTSTEARGWVNDEWPSEEALRALYRYLPAGDRLDEVIRALGALAAVSSSTPTTTGGDDG